MYNVAIQIPPIYVVDRKLNKFADNHNIGLYKDELTPFYFPSDNDWDLNNCVEEIVRYHKTMFDEYSKMRNSNDKFTKRILEKQLYHYNVWLNDEDDAIPKILKLYKSVYEIEDDLDNKYRTICLRLLNIAMDGDWTSVRLQGNDWIDLYFDMDIKDSDRLISAVKTLYFNHGSQWVYSNKKYSMEEIKSQNFVDKFLVSPNAKQSDYLLTTKSNEVIKEIQHFLDDCNSNIILFEYNGVTPVYKIIFNEKEIN